MKSVTKIFIKSIELKNSKSFEGSIEVGPFHHCLNILIGPNWSGKSNVLDALSFTFGGEVCDLRSKNLKELITINKLKNNLFTSSSIFLLQERIILNNSLKQLWEISITRKVFKNGKSNFFLNGEETKLFFLKFPFEGGIFSIKQGEIESSFKMESNGKPRRQMRVIKFIEEISRTSNYFSFLLKNLNHSNDFDFVVKLFYVYILKIFKKDFVIIRKKKCKRIIFGRKKDIFKIFFINEFFLKILKSRAFIFLRVKNTFFSVETNLPTIKKIKISSFLNICTIKNLNIAIVQPILKFWFEKIKYFQNFVGPYIIHIFFKKT